jgi:hypothetical protein
LGWVCCAPVWMHSPGWMEDGVQVLAGLAPSSQAVGSLLRTPWSARPAVEMMVLILIFIYFQTYNVEMSIRQTRL